MSAQPISSPRTRRHILVIDDDPDMRAFLETFLLGEGFEVSLAEHGTAMREVLAAAVIDMVIVDLMLPGEDGFALVRYLRDRYQLGIIMLTARDNSIDRIVGLEVGADDYVTKPFEARELLARIRSVLRRVGQTGDVVSAATDLTKPSDEEGLRIGTWQLDRNARGLVGASGETVELTTGEYTLLCEFVDNPGRILSREVLLAAVRNRDWDYFDRSIDILVNRLRRKIEADPSHPTLIKTVRGAGYLFAGASS
ncbi:MAG: response regulator [Azospirillum sp.]|nr:response regulator [Azospirillum sp.]